MPSVVLLSGGLDSAVCLALERGQERFALGINYGQPHHVELEYAARIANAEGVPFTIAAMPPCRKSDDVVFTGRNFAMIGIAVAAAASRGADRVVIGSNFTDFDRFPDCRPEFIKSVNAAMRAGDYGISVVAPLMHKTKAQVWGLARSLGVGDTWSCYSPKDDNPCGDCLACRVREDAA